MKTRNRILSMLAAVGLAIGILSTTVFATESRCDHIWKTEWDSDSSYHWYECSSCKKKKDMNEHSMEQKSDEDNHWKECSVCHAETSAEGHNWDHGDVTTPATCTTAGVKTFTCHGCGTTKTDSIPATGHQWQREQGWTSDATHHWKKCISANCSERLYYGQHKGGTATCTDRAVCETCGAEYGETDSANHTGTAGLYWSADNSAHWKEYNCCKGRIDIAAHSGDSSATCIQKGKCWYCGVFYYGDHSYGALSFNENEHWQKCIYCGDVQNKISHNFSKQLKSEATCVSPEVYDMICTDCDYQVAVPQGDVDPTNHDLVRHDAKAPTCTEKGWAAYETCKREGCDYTTYAEIPALNHDLVHHDAKTPTCTEKGWSAYDTCTRCDYTTYVEQPVDPDNHALTHVKAQAPTCTDYGWDAYDICQRCGYTTFKELPALGHWYSEWTPNGDGTQIATCKRGCGHKAKVKCAEQEYALPMGKEEEAYEFTLCPVCGQVSENVKLALVEKVTAKAVTRWLPAGEPVLRLGTLENGELVLIAGFEYVGQLTQPTGQVQFTLPAEHLKGFTLTVINADGMETPLDYTTEKDQATFTLDFTDAKTPTILIHLAPEA